jgi:hypothetical protein
MQNTIIRFVIISVLALPILAVAQQRPALSSGVPTQTSLAVPNLVLSRHFFTHLSTLETQGDQAEAAGNNASIYREYYRKLLGFTPQQYAAVKSAAIRTQTQLQEIDAEARRTVQDFRRQLAASKQDQLPPPPVELKALEEKRALITASAMSQLRTQLGTTAFEHLNAVIAAQFGKNIKVQKVMAAPQRAGDPAAPPLANTPVFR